MSINTGPCGQNELFFPYAWNSNKGMVSCFRIVDDGKMAFEEVEDACLDANGLGSSMYNFYPIGPQNPGKHEGTEFSLLTKHLSSLERERR